MFSFFMLCLQFLVLILAMAMSQDFSDFYGDIPDYGLYISFFIVGAANITGHYFYVYRIFGIEKALSIIQDAEMSGNKRVFLIYSFFIMSMFVIFIIINLLRYES